MNVHRLLMFVLMFVTVLTMSVGVGAAAVITVDDSGSAMYTSIQAAIDAASLGDEIHVDSGTYYENVNVNKWLILRGIDTGAGMPVVDAGGYGDAITLNVDWITLEGFTVTNGGSAGIWLDSSNNNKLSSNTAFGNYEGIYLYSSSNNTLIGNTASDNSEFGIWLDSSSNNNTLSSNIASDNSNSGIVLTSSCNNNTLSSNTAFNNTYYGISLDSSSNNMFSSNTVSNNTYGISLSYSSNNTLSSNTASNNSITGILLYYFSDNNMLSGNTASNNDYGIWLDSSSNNILYHNNLVDNTNYNAYDSNVNNQWDSGFEGNYWSDYTGTDSNGDGIGDTPYYISGDTGVQDRYPLMQPYNIIVIKGDFNNNGRVDIGDVAKVAFMVAGIVPEELSADFNDNGYVDIGDAAKIAFYLAGKVGEL